MTTTDKPIVFVVTRSEEHSDYVEAVFCKRENAEKYCKQFNDNEDEYSRDITEVKCLDTQPTSDHWQDVRERAAIAAMQGVMNFFGSLDYDRETIAELAVKQADALVEKLKGE